MTVLPQERVQEESEGVRGREGRREGSREEEGWKRVRGDRGMEIWR